MCNARHRGEPIWGAESIKYAFWHALGSDVLIHHFWFALLVQRMDCWILRYFLSVLHAVKEQWEKAALFHRTNAWGKEHGARGMWHLYTSLLFGSLG